MKVTPEVDLEPLIGKDDCSVKDGKKTAPRGTKDDNDTRHVELKDDNDTRLVELKD